MSLKAKIEAVIYASEEPVTLAQLIGLLGEEAQAELDALTAQQAELALESEAPAGDADALNAEVLEPTEADSVERVADSEARPTEPAEQLPDENAASTAAADEASAKAEARAQERALRGHLRAQVDELMADYANGDRGIEVREVAGGFRFATKPEYHDAVRGFIKALKPPMKLSLQALETLAVVAYKQPVTAPEIGEIRGVDSGGVLGSLLARKLITTAGRKPVIGRPILYKTTKEFLIRFGLKDINELPSIEEFEKMAGEFADLDAAQEEIPMDVQPQGAGDDEARKTAEALEPSADEHAGQADGEPEAEALESDGDGGEEGSPVEHPAEEAIVDGRQSGVDPDYAKDEEENPSAVEAEIQDEANGR